MTHAIPGVRLPAPVAEAAGRIAGPAGGVAGPGFGEMLASAVETVEKSRGEAARAVEQFLRGEAGELHATLVAVQKAELTLELFLEARNKVLQAYQEIMRMQI